MRWLALGAALALVSLIACGTSPAGSTSRSPTPKPVPRGYASMAGAPNGGVILFGGFGSPPAPKWVEDTWLYRDGHWQQIPTKVLPNLGDSTMVCMQTCDRLVYLSDGGYAWQLDPIARTWVQKAGGGPSWHGIQGAFDSQSDRMIVFGGDKFDEMPRNETWAYDPVTDHWTQMHPATSPPARFFFAMAYDPQTDRVIAFGGFGDSLSLLADTWAYDYDHDTWVQLPAMSAPSPRSYTRMVYDPSGKRLILFGGAGPGEAPLGDTWVFDSIRNSWTELKVTGPTARAWHTMAFDSGAQAIVLFGGGPTRRAYTNDVWLFASASNAWAKQGG